MEAALQSLTNTLGAINTRQAAVRKRARKGANATPFTTAVLNRERLDIITYIRDADPHTEASLFWYPPAARASQQARAGPSSLTAKSHQSGSGRAAGQPADDQTESELLIAPRLPEPRHIAPPTPLRKGFSSKAKEYASADDGPADAHVLLQAAQRLNDTYRRAPRAAKHIKTLIKTHSTLTSTIKQYEVLIRENERKLRNASDGKGPVEDVEPDTAAQSRDDARDDGKLQQDLTRIQETIQNEELEILALEEMIAELNHAKDLAAQKALEESDQTMSTPEYDETLRRRPSSFGVPTAYDVSKIRSEPEVEEEQQEPEPDVSATEEHHAVEDKEPAPEEYSHDASASLQHDELGEADETILADTTLDETETIGDESLAAVPTRSEREPTPLVYHEGETDAQHEEREPAPVPESSEELERVTEKVWDVFGDALRYAAPERELADFVETLDVLHKLMSGGEKSHLGDFSVGSTNTSSTHSTAVSEASAGAAQLTPEILMTAFVIWQMLVSPEPHQMNIDDLKVKGHEWWAAQGMQTWRRSRSSDEHELSSQVEAFEDGQNLARKATYGMISKKLFAIKRHKGVGLVAFA